MDPVSKSAVTTVASIAVGTALGGAVAAGYITKDQAASLTVNIVSDGSIVVGAFLIWYKARQHTQVAQIAAVRKADNGVTVVPEAAAAAAGIAPVSGPLK